MAYISREKENLEGPGRIAKFDPNSKPLPKPQWATFAPFRNPQWKIHSNIGHVKNAMKCHRWIIRYDYDEGYPLANEPAGWREVERKEGRS